MFKFFLFILVIVELSLGTVFFLTSAIKYLPYPYDITISDTNIVNLVYLFMKGMPLYENICRFPYRINPYSPVYYVFSAFLGKLINIKSYFYLLVLCRSVTLFTTLVCSIIIFAISYKLKHSRLASLIASLLFLGNPILFGWGFAARVDLMAVTYSLIAIYLLLFENNRFSLHLSVLFSLLAAYTKQPYLTTAVAIIIYFILQDRLREAVKFTLYFIGAGSTFFILLNYVSSGVFYLNLVGANVFAPFNLKFTIDIFRVVWWNLLPNFLLAIIGIKILKAKEWLLIKIYTLVSIATAIGTTFRAGGGENHWLGVLVATVLISASIIHKLYLSKNRIIFSLILLVLLFPYSRYGIAWMRGRFVWEKESTYVHKIQLVDIFKKTKGYVFYTGGLDVLIHAGKPILSNDWGIYGNWAQRGKCSDSKLVSMIEKKEFGCIVHYFGDIVKESWLTENMRQAIIRNYEVGRVISTALIYVPKTDKYNAASNKIDLITNIKD